MIGQALLGLALFLVFVVMAVQYESLRDPLVIILSVPFALIGVAIGLEVSALPLSMPIWLGLIMLAGIVVNNAIVLVEYIEIERGRGLDTQAAIVEAARLRLSSPSASGVERTSSISSARCLSSRSWRSAPQL